MRNERVIRRFILVAALLMSGSLLYGGYQVHREANRKTDYKQSLESRAAKINVQLCEEMGAPVGWPVNDAVRFLRACAEGL